jgi:hypothetical protein
MSEVIISPGVFQIESDQSLYTTAPPVLGAAIVGPTVNGSPYIPTYITTYNQYLTLFGDIFQSGSYYYEYFTSMAAREYFQNGGRTLLVTRVIASGSDSVRVSTYASSSITNFGTFATASIDFSGLIGDGDSFIISGSNNRISQNNNVTFFITSSTTQTNIVGSTYYILYNANTTTTLRNIVNAITVRSQPYHNVTAGISGSFLNFSTTFPGSLGNQFKAGAPGSPTTFAGGNSGSGTSFELETLTWGDTMNSAGTEVSGALVNGSAYNVRWEIVGTNTDKGTFTLLVRRGDDNNTQKNILETWSNLSLDPQRPNYISRIIGDRKAIPDVTTGTISHTGNYPNISRYIRVKSVTTPNADSIANDGNFKRYVYGGSLPAISSGSFGGGLLDIATSSIVRNMNESIGIGDSTINNIQGFLADDYANGFNMLSDKEGFQFNLLMAPGVGLDTSAASNMITIAETRGDCIAVIDAGKYNTAITTAVQNASGQQSSYGATYYPWVQLFSNNLGKSVWCPPTTVIGGVMAFNDQVTAEWFAPAGLNRGTIPSVLKAERRLQQTDRDTLYEGNVNPIATFPGSGIAVWGQKTLQQKQTALDRINVRRLLINLKGYIGNIARTLVFEQNTTATRNRFLAQVNPYLASVVQRQGLYAYKVVMDESNNTPDVIDRNQLVGQIYIQPTKTAEFVILNFNILPTGATFPA